MGPFFWGITLNWKLISTFFLAAALPLTAISDEMPGLTAPTVEVKPVFESEKPKVSFFEEYTTNINGLLIKGLEFVGIRYRWGGNTPEEGMDCSGFVKLVFSEGAGIKLPRTALEQSKHGDKIDIQNLKPGDLVFFNTMRRAYSHVGIYIGNNQFLHAPRTGKHIQVEDLSDNWIKKFNGGRRLIEAI